MLKRVGVSRVLWREAIKISVAKTCPAEHSMFAAPEPFPLIAQQLRTQEAGEKQVLKPLEQAMDAYTAGNISVRMVASKFNVPKCNNYSL